jgi:hypothetical protein
MSRHRPDDNRDDYDDRPRGKKSNAPPIIALVVGGGLFLLLVCGGVLVLLGWVAMPGRQVAQNAAAPPTDAAVIQPAGGKEGEKRTYTREEFRQLVMGKTPEEVIAAVGRPSSTNDNPDSSPRTWYYWSRVTNPATGKPDSGILEFAGGKVSQVRW